jgi:hypothetical protein
VSRNIAALENLSERGDEKANRFRVARKLPRRREDDAGVWLSAL